MGKIGGGPNEFISPQYAGIVQNKYINIYDFNLRQLSKVEITQDNRCVEFSRVKLKDDDLLIIAGDNLFTFKLRDAIDYSKSKNIELRLYAFMQTLPMFLRKYYPTTEDYLVNELKSIDIWND